MKYLSALFLLALLASCTHTNELGKYDPRGKTAHYSYYVSGDAMHSGTFIRTNTESPTSVASTIAAIGGAVVEGMTEEKIQRAVRPDSLAYSFAKGVEQSMKLYLKMNAVPTLEENPDLIVQTALDECEINSGPGGVSAKVGGTSRIIDRKTSKVIWENSESESVPLRMNYGAGSGLGSIISAVQLSTLSETELARAIFGAAQDAGREMGETLRKDAAELK